MGDSLKICVLFDVISTPWGGGNQFLKGLAAELVHKGHDVTSRPTSSTDVILLNAFRFSTRKYLTPSQVAHLKRTGRFSRLGGLLPPRFHMRRSRLVPPLVHRVDGVPELARGHRTAADDLQPAVNRLTDHTVFQSQFCKRTFASHCRFTPESSRIILNGVDPTMFFPDPANTWADGPIRLVAVSWSPNPRKGFAAVADMSRLPGIEMTFVGNWCPDVDPANVKLVGVLQSAEVAGLLRSSHAMLHAAWNEPSANAIMEAMACGLPVIYRDSGGNRELAGDYGVPMDEDLPGTVDSLRRRYVELRRKVIEDGRKFAIGRATDEYVSFFRHAIERRSASADQAG